MDGNKGISLIKRRSSEAVSNATATALNENGDDTIRNLDQDQQINSNEDGENYDQVGGSGNGIGSPEESNNYSEEDGESDDDDDDDELDMDADDDLSEGSFPTNKDLASFAVNSSSSSRPPESVSYLGSMSVGGGGGGGGGGYGVNINTMNSGISSSTIRDGNENVSATGVNERKLSTFSSIHGAPTGGGEGGGGEISGYASFTVSQRSLSFSSDNEQRPISGGFMMVPSYAASETAKSDIATVCSNSVVEDIDIASVGTAHSATNSNPTGTTSATASATTNPVVQHPNDATSDKSIGKKKQDRGVEFSAGMSTMWKYRRFNGVNTTMKSGSSPKQSSSRVPRIFNLGTLNDMGPPLNRSLLERVGGGSGPSSTGTPSRAGSVKSFGSQAASDVVHVDTDDCGGSIAVDSDGHFSGLDENPSFQSNENVASTTAKNPGNHFSSTSATSDANRASQEHNINNDEFETQNKVVSLDKLCESHPNGRVSPGGTVYKGRGVRKYQGRYMHLPLKRFKQNGAVLPEPVNHDQDSIRNEYNEDNDHQQERRSWQRDRSRSRDRDTNNNEKRRNRSKSPQPSWQINGNRNNQNGRDRNSRGNGRGRWKHGRSKNDGSGQRYKQQGNYHNSSRRGNKNGGSFHMTPRDARHIDLK